MRRRLRLRSVSLQRRGRIRPLRVLRRLRARTGRRQSGL